MAITQNKRLVIVVFFLLCFISSQATARTLKERINGNSRVHKKEARDGIFKPKENDKGNADGEVFSMDYTPARKKPPIHN
ncbi:hypothetical protein QN277_006438 [Acacia crassicarpa]|uniref:Uncharacterized protein n=1 Tax=Acacia crassicarpa TaxID=499986 RepID=A0AAE1IUY0_9FABA|nr:hypothetical protein QN277_006438 [Acacia crassicarpa]